MIVKKRRGSSRKDNQKKVCEGEGGTREDLRKIAKGGPHERDSRERHSRRDRCRRATEGGQKERSRKKKAN